MAGSFGKIKSLIINYPPLQGTLILIISLILIFVLKTTFNGWLIAATAILFFAAGTTVLGLLKKKWTGYVIQSVVTLIYTGNYPCIIKSGTFYLLLSNYFNHFLLCPELPGGHIQVNH
jgi:energy-converting hydrogenase Eha subunit G